ncbi:MAG: hypothetical protein KC492_17320, partial [Myxococcales bacterium]|nr:hypothetical protein [Myxococcales bacterium]
HVRLAHALDDLPSLVVDEEHDAVDALVAEALPLARAADNPWLEVFIRHWELQSKVLNREQVKDSLPLAVELLELSSRPETKDCPQAVCATQDLASCYATLDGPGYVAERVAVAKETLARIDPTWPCFLCISSELVDALLDGAEAEAALNEVKQVRAALLERDQRQECPALIRPRVDALFALGRFEEALMELELWDEPASGSSGEMAIRLRKVRAHAALGQITQAKDLLPDPESISKTPSHYSAWIRAAEALVAAGGLTNDAELGAVLRGMRLSQEQNGAHFLAFESAVVGTELALARGARQTARLELHQVDRLFPQLRAPKAPGVVPWVQRMEAARASLSEADPAPPPLEQAPSPEVMWENAAAAVDWQTEVLDGQALDAVLSCLETMGYLAEAESVAERAVEGASDQAARLTASLRWAELLSHVGQAERALSVLDGLGELRGEEFWLRARAEVDCLRRLGDDKRLKTRLGALCERPDVPPGAVLLLSDLEQRLGDARRAFALALRAAEALPRGEADWKVIELGTELGAWSEVRRAANRLGMPVELGAAPIDEEWGLVQVVFPEDTQRKLVALRTGPVTARVLELCGPTSDVEHGDDRVIFDPEPVEPPPGHQHGPDCDHEHDHGHDHDEHGHGCEEDHEHGPDCAHSQAEEWIPVFAVRKIVAAGELESFTIDGLHPGDDALQAIADLLDGFGGRLEVRSPDEYSLRVPDLLPDLGWPRPAPGERPAVYGFFAVPAAQDARAVHDALRTLCSTQRALLVWPELCEAAGDDEALDLHVELGDCLGL